MTDLTSSYSPCDFTLPQNGGMEVRGGWEEMAQARSCSCTHVVVVALPIYPRIAPLSLAPLRML